MLWECGFAINDKNKKEWNFPPTIKVIIENNPFWLKNGRFEFKMAYFDLKMTRNDPKLKFFSRIGHGVIQKTEKLECQKYRKVQLFNFTRPNNHLHCYIYFIVLILLWQGRPMKNDFWTILGQRWNSRKIFPIFRLLSKIYQKVDFGCSKMSIFSSRKKFWRKNPAADPTLKSHFHQYFTLCYFERLLQIPIPCVGGLSRRIN